MKRQVVFEIASGLVFIGLLVLAIWIATLGGTLLPGTGQ